MQPGRKNNKAGGIQNQTENGKAVCSRVRRPGPVQPTAPGRSAEADPPCGSEPAGPPITIGKGLGEEAHLRCESTPVRWAGFACWGELGWIYLVETSYVRKEGICPGFAKRCFVNRRVELCDTKLRVFTSVMGCPESPRCGGEAWPYRPNVGAPRGFITLLTRGAPKSLRTINKVHCLSVCPFLLLLYSSCFLPLYHSD